MFEFSCIWGMSFFENFVVFNRMVMRFLKIEWFCVICFCYCVCVVGVCWKFCFCICSSSWIWRFLFNFVWYFLCMCIRVFLLSRCCYCKSSCWFVSFLMILLDGFGLDFYIIMIWVLCFFWMCFSIVVGLRLFGLWVYYSEFLVCIIYWENGVK